MLEEEFETLGDLIVQQPLKDETGSEIGIVGIGRPGTYRHDVGCFCCYQIAYASGTVRMLERANSTPQALQAAMDNLAVWVYAGTGASACFDRWQGFAEIHEVPEAAASLEQKDWARAVPFLSRLAERGIAWARSRLGTAFLMGFGVDVDEEKGIRWTTLAAEQGDPGSNDLLAGMYRFPESKHYDPGKERYYAERAKLCGSEIFAGPANTLDWGRSGSDER